MSTMPAPPPRHALGLPAGSIRALLGLGVLGLLWGLALKFPHKLPLSFIYLLFLMLLILAHYFAAHGKSVGHVKERSALGLPRGSIRFLLMAGFLGLAYYLYRTDTAFEVPASGPFFFLIALLLSGFFVGYLLTSLIAFLGGGRLPAWFQDVQAWFALLGLLGLVILVMVYVIINPSLAEGSRINVDQLEAFLAAIVGFYFGARS
ncbi:MAG: hypothetical protein HYS12_22455 [Planctomycetes bacterium]|nr:hypothetical protein [Planctomycetota bacterium]